MIGLDFDNTIVCYDDVFGRIAVAQGLVPPSAATSKSSVRDYLRSTRQENQWTELQGYVYGPGMREASPFSGVSDFLRRCRQAGVPVAIVSHRTRFPYLGEQYDLHQAARDWLASQGFHADESLGLPVDQVFFEETKEAKLGRVGALGCSVFIDDLPELLAAPEFPAGVRKILFDPHGVHRGQTGTTAASSWREIAELVEIEPSVPRNQK